MPIIDRNIIQNAIKREVNILLGIALDVTGPLGRHPITIPESQGVLLGSINGPLHHREMHCRFHYVKLPSSTHPQDQSLVV